MDGSQKRSRKFRKWGNKTNRRFLDDRAPSADPGQGGLHAFKLNFFHTNVTTLAAMLYGRMPRVDVSREEADPNDDVARVASLLLQRILQNDIEASGEKFDSVLKGALQDRLIPGMGIGRVRYEVDETEQEAATEPQPAAPVAPQQGQPPPDNVVQMAPPTPPVLENAPIDYVHWDDFRWSYARTWGEVWWEGFRSYMTKEAAVARFGDAKADELTYKHREPAEDKDAQSEGGTDRELEDTEATAEVWELWSEAHKQVFWYAKGLDKILDQKDDPLKLPGFYPNPRPMTANTTTKLFMPKADYVMAQDLYNEIDTLQTRISIITEAVRVVGVYDENAGDSVGRIFKEGVENDLIPVPNWSMFAEKGGLAGVIDWFPVQEIVATLSTLTDIRGQTIELLYQVTGMSDVMRGALTDAREGVGQSKIKARFASVRVQAIQEDFARFASDLQTLKAQVIGRHFTPENILLQANAQFIAEPDKQYLEQAIALIKSPAAKWRIEIKPESIAMIDYEALQEERGSYLTAAATFIQSSQAMIKESAAAGPMLMGMLKWSMAGLKGSKEMEGILDQGIKGMTMELQQKQQQPDPAQQALQQKMQVEQQKNQLEIQKNQQKHQLEMQAQQAKNAQAMQLQAAKFQQQMQLENTSFQNDMKKMMADVQADMKKQAQKTQSDVTTEISQAELDINVDDNATQNQMAIDDNDTANTLTEQDNLAAHRENEDDDIGP